MNMLLSLFTDCLYLLMLSILWPILAYRVIFKKKYRDACGERWGRIGHLPRKQGMIWVHGVSVGEVKGALPLVRELQRALPGREFMISATSSAGRKLAEKLYPECTVVSFPLDFSWAVSRYRRHFSPSLVLLVELELWPNFLREMQHAGVPMILVNGRLSLKSFRGYRLLGAAFRTMTRGIALFAVQNETYARRFRELGIDRTLISVTGNMKFDAATPEKWAADRQNTARSLGIEPGHRVLVFGSTHPGEEELFLSCHRELLAEFPDFRAVIVPRHPERAGELEELSRRFSLDAHRTSALPSEGFRFEANRVVIGDVMGELTSLYTIAHVVVIGGSLVPHGGQNFMEPASLEKAVVCGPYMENFPEAQDFVEQEAMVQIQSPDSLRETVAHLLRSPEKVRRLGQNAALAVQRGRGSVLRNCGLCLQILGEARSQGPQG